MQHLLLVLALSASCQPEPPAATPAFTTPAVTATLDASDAQIAAFFDDFIARKVEALEVPGAALVVMRDGRTLLQKGYGHIDLATRRPIDPDSSLFRAASISKLLPWVLVMQLVEAGRLDLDADINRYLDFEVPQAFGQPLTMRHLMTHTAGFPERFHGVFDPDLATPLGAKLRDNLPPIVHAPGSTVAYSNYGAALAGYIVARLHGQPWEQLVAERIFAPLGMRNATVAQPVPPAMAAQLVATYTAQSNTPVVFRTTPLAPMGALTASAADMGRLLSMLLDGGVGAHGRLLSAASVKQMVQLQRPLGRGLDDGMGLGLLVGRYRGVRYAGHAGNMSTLATDLELLPDHGIGWYYVFSTQGPGEAARKVREELLAAVIDRFLSPAPPSIAAVGPSTAVAVAGDYVSTRRLHHGPLAFSGLMNITTVRANPDGTLDIESSGERSRWLPAGCDRFVEPVSGTALAATRDASGSVVRLASAALYPAAEFERAPGFLRIVPWIAAFSFATLAVAMPVRSGTWLLRRWRGTHAGACTTGASATDAAATVRRWAQRAFRLLAVTLLGWATVALALATDFGLLFAIPLPARVLLGALTLASGACAALLLADAALALRGGRSLPNRTGALLVALAAVGVAWLFQVFGVWQFSTDW